MALPQLALHHRRSPMIDHDRPFVDKRQRLEASVPHHRFKSEPQIR
jgi:hypothetical protein